MLGDVRLSSAPVRLLFLRTRPGYEGSVADALRSCFRATGASPHSNVRILAGLGDYDLVAVIRGDPSRSTLAGCGAIPNILGTREVICFGFDSPEPLVTPPIPDFLAGGPAYSFTFVRLPGFLTTSRTGLPWSAPERSFLDWFRREAYDRGPRPVLLGTLGGPEFVVVGVGDSLRKVYERIASLRADAGLIEKTYTLIAVTDEVFAQGSAESPVALGACGAHLGAEVRVAVRPQHREPILELARGIFEPSIVTLAFIPGAEDVLIGLRLDPETDLGVFVAKVLLLRWMGRDLILGTSTTFTDLQDLSGARRTSVDDLRKQFLETRNPIPLIALSGDEARRIHQLPRVGPLTVRAVYAYFNLLQNDLIGSELVDMLAFFWSFRERALQIVTEDSASVAYLSEQMLSAHHGVDQRTIGSHAGINPVETLLRHNIGGIHKIIQAAQAIPYSVFHQYQRALWAGFVIVGAATEFWGQHQVIAVPPDRMWEPDRWAALLHESVHCLVRQLGLVPEGELADLCSLVHAKWPSNCSREHMENVVLELIVDLIQQNFGPLWDPEFTVRCRWEYIKERIRPTRLTDLNLEQFAVRASSLWACGRVGFAARHMPAIEEFINQLPSLEELYASWQDSLGTWLRTHDRPGVGVLGEMVVALEPVYQYASKRVRFDAEAVSERRKWWSEDLCRSLEGIDKAQPTTSEGVRFPELFVWGLRKQFSQVQMTAGQRTAAYLSLVDYYRQRVLEAQRQDGAV